MTIGSLLGGRVVVCNSWTEERLGFGGDGRSRTAGE